MQKIKHQNATHTAILTALCKMHWLSEQICHRTQASGVWEVNKVVFWKIALHSCTCRETEVRQTPPSPVIWQKCFLCSFQVNSGKKNIINHLYSLVQMQGPKSQSHCRVANRKEERHPNQQSAVSGSKNELRTEKGKRESGPCGSRALPLVLATLTWLNTEERLPSVSHRTENFCLCIQNCNNQGQPEEIYTGTWPEILLFSPFPFEVSLRTGKVHWVCL